MGKEARAFADFLAAGGQRYWQLLPLGPTGYGDSPYQSFSTFAGNPYLIDLDFLAEEGLLTEPEYAGEDWGEDPQRVDFGLLYRKRYPVLKKAVRRLLERKEPALVAVARRASPPGAARSGPDRGGAAGGDGLLAGRAVSFLPAMAKT